MAALAGTAMAALCGGLLLLPGPVVQDVAEVYGIGPSRHPPGLRAPTLGVGARDEEDATLLTVEVVDDRLEPVGGLEVWVQGNGGTAASLRQARTTGPDGRATFTLSAASRARYGTAGNGRYFRSDDGIGLVREEQVARLQVLRLCPGPVAIVAADPPERSTMWLHLAARVELIRDEAAVVAQRACGRQSVLVRWTGRDGERRYRDGWVDVVDDERVEVALDALADRAALAHAFRLHLDCTDCPQLVDSCTGSEREWRCSCEGACTPIGRWPEALFDWRTIKRPLVKVEPGDTDVFVHLPDETGDVEGVWTGPQPCGVAAVNRETGARVEGECLADGTFFVEDLFVGPWTVEAGWASDGRIVGEAARRDVEVRGAADVGALGAE